GIGGDTMAFKIADRVSETTVTTGTGTLSLLGANRAHQSFSAGIGNSNSTTYGILSGNGVDYEIGVGTYTSAGSTLSRSAILASSTGGSAISLTGTSLVFCVNPANQFGQNGLWDQALGATQGSIIYHDSAANGWKALGPGSAGQALISGGAGANPSWGAGGGGGGSGTGLFGPDLSAVPTQASTGLS